MNRYIPLSLLALVACGGDGGPGPIEPTPNQNDISSLQPGQYRVLTPSDIPNGIDLPSVPEARDFLIVVGNTSAFGDVEANYVVRGNLGVAASMQASPRIAASPQLMAGVGALERATAPQRRLEEKVRGFERSKLSFRRMASPGSASASSARWNTQVAPVPTVGEIINLKVPDAETLDTDGQSNLCKFFYPTQAEVVSVSNRAILAVDTRDGNPLALGFTQADYDAITAEFDAITYPADEAYFGTPTDIDANMGHVIMLFTGRVNELTPPGTPPGDGFVGGFFFAGDFFPPTGVPDESCAQSNQAEIFYLLAPDPGGLRYGNDRTAASVRQGTRGTIAHEFVHMINAGRRYTGGVATSFEVSWLDEALAHMGEEAVGRRVKNFGDLQSLSHADIFPNQAARDDYNAFFFQNLARLRLWMLAPDTSSGISKRAAENLSSRGAGWALVRYAADNFSNSNPPVFTRALVAGPDTGLTNFNRRTVAPLDTVLAGWLVANYSDDLVGGTVTNARTQYRSYNLRTVMPPVSGGAYPLKLESVGSAASLSGKNRTGSGTYYTLSVAANSAARNVKVLNSGGASLVSYPGAHVYVYRIR